MTAAEPTAGCRRFALQRSARRRCPASSSHWRWWVVHLGVEGPWCGWIPGNGGCLRGGAAVVPAAAVARMGVRAGLFGVRECHVRRRLVGSQLSRISVRRTPPALSATHPGCGRRTQRRNVSACAKSRRRRVPAGWDRGNERALPGRRPPTADTMPLLSAQRPAEALAAARPPHPTPSGSLCDRSRNPVPSDHPRSTT
jgi:hypothetical protein